MKRVWVLLIGLALVACGFSFEYVHSLKIKRTPPPKCEATQEQC